ncbi:ice-binding family protein, partial [Flavobacterium sp. LT1R49]|uniref:ice-binding family protein n=1 Tax=Flavobacterium arabinosi TaxID=3398737 RepID=UPI003A8918D8
MKKKLLYSIITIALLSFPNIGFGQVLNLGTLTNFSAYSGTGAVSNTGKSTYHGDIGTNVGAISGFGPASTFGVFHNADATTTQAKIDLLRVYIHLSDLPLTNTTHAAAFGSGETITAGVYLIAGAGSLTGTLTLDGQGNTNAAFVIKFEGGFSSTAGSEIILANGARACNVFWIAEGAISIGSSSITKGTLIAHPGAITIGGSGDIEGRMLSTEGAISFGPGVATIPAGPITIPIACDNTCNNNILGTAANFALFTSVGAVANAATSGIVGDIGSNDGDISGFASSTVAGSFHHVDATTAQAKIDLQAAYVQLSNTPATNTSHTPAFGSGETLTAGVYSIAGAGSLAGTITLNGQGNANALFIFKFAGAFTTAAQSKVILTNGVRRCNVFWVAEGAISMGTFTFMKGTLIAHDGANTMGANGNLEGRMLSTKGAIGFSTGVIYNNTLCFADPIPVIDAINDTAASINGYTGGTFTNVLSNDTLNGVAVVSSKVNTTFVSATNAGVTLSGTDILVAPGTPAGTYSLVYKICEILNPTNCDQATVSVTVTAPIIDAVNDTASINGYTGGTFTNVLSNDMLNGVAVVSSKVNTTFVSATNLGITLSGTDVVVASGIPAGTYSLVYKICEILNPTNCDQATVIITVTAPIIDAINDTTSINGYTGGTFTNVLSNDMLNGVAVVSSKVNTTFVSATNLGITLSGTDVVVASGIPAGTYSLVYKICEILNPTNCDQATVTVTVTAPIIDAVDDTYNSTCSTNGTLGNILTNDTLNGFGFNSSNVTITLQSGGNPNLSLNTTTGDIIVNGLSIGQYTLVYKICQVVNPNNCDTANIKITITDTTAPVITCPVDFNIGTNTACTYVGAIGTATATDNCDTSVTITNNAPAAFPIGETIVTWTATDDAGKIATCTQKVTINDDDAPVITCPVDFNIGTNTACTYVGAIGTATATDNCDTSVTITN